MALIPLTDPKPPVPAHIMRFAISGVSIAAPWTNVFWARNGKQSQPTPTQFQDVTQDVFNAFYNSLAHQSALQNKLQTCVGLYYMPNGDVIGSEVAGTQTGNQGDDCLPANVALCISWHVQQRYRGGHPRTYLAGQPGEKKADNTSWIAAYCSATQDFANQFHSTVNSINHGEIADVHLGTLSTQLRKQWRDPPIFRDYTLGAAHVDTRIDSQRRRLGRDRP